MAMRRRDLLKKAGLAVLGAPFLSLLSDGPARAEPGVAKYLFLFMTSGTDSAQWTPTGSTASNLVFRPMNQPLAALREDLVIVENLDSFGTAQEHFDPGGLTGHGPGSTAPYSSVDQYIADALYGSGVRTEFPFLLLGGNPTETPSTFFSDGAPLVPIMSPIDAFNVIFAGGVPPDADAVDFLRQRRSTLDFVTREMVGLSTRLGAEERQKLELHAESVRQLEERLRRRTEDIGAGVGTCAPPAPVDGAQPLLDAEIDLELAVHALRCDLTRVVSVQIGHHQHCPVDLPSIGQPGDWHDDFLHGDAEPRTRLRALERRLAEQFVSVANALKAAPAPDGAGTLWDQTLLVWARDMGDGVVHRGDDLRFVLTGGANGYLQKSPGGRYLDAGGQHHQRVLLDLVQAMGITDLSGFGDPAAGANARLPLTGVAS